MGKKRTIAAARRAGPTIRKPLADMRVDSGTHGLMRSPGPIRLAPLGGMRILGVVVMLALALCLTIVGPALPEVGFKATGGDLPAVILGLCGVAGGLHYQHRGRRNFRRGAAAAI